MDSLFVTVDIAVELIMSIILLWFTSQIILKTNQIKPFVPFVILSFIQACYAGFTSFGLYTSPVWAVVGLASFLAIFLMVSPVIRKI